MVATMIRYGYALPEIVKVDGPYVRTALTGRRPDIALIEFQLHSTPPELIEDISALLLHHLSNRGGIDATTVLQRSDLESADAVARLGNAHSPIVIVHVT